MRNGIVLFTCDRGITPARGSQGRGGARFRYLLRARAHPHPDPAGRPAPAHRPGATCPDDRYLRVLDPWVSLATAAAVTSRIRLGTAVALPAESDPITLAKTIATAGSPVRRPGDRRRRLRLEHR